MPGVCPEGGGVFKFRFDWYITPSYAPISAKPEMGAGHRVGILTYFSKKNYQNSHTQVKNNCQKYQKPPLWGKGRAYSAIMLIIGQVSSAQVFPSKTNRKIKVVMSHSTWNMDHL